MRTKIKACREADPVEVFRRRANKFGRSQSPTDRAFGERYATRGRWPSPKSGTIIDYHNQLERHCLVRLECMPKVSTIEPGPTLTWSHDNLSFTTVFPLMYGDRNRGPVLVDVKAMKTVDDHDLRPFFPAIEIAAEVAGYAAFEFWSDAMLTRQPSLSNCELISVAMRDEDDDADTETAQQMVAFLLSIGRPVPIRTILSRAPEEPSCFHVLLRLLGRGILVIVDGPTISGRNSIDGAAEFGSVRPAGNAWSFDVDGLLTPFDGHVDQSVTLGETLIALGCPA